MVLTPITDRMKYLLNRMNPAAMEAKLGDVIEALQNAVNTGSTAAPFNSTEQTGTDTAQDIPHGLKVVPRTVIIEFSNIPSGGASYTYTVDATNVVVTATLNAKYFVHAIA